MPTWPRIKNWNEDKPWLKMDLLDLLDGLERLSWACFHLTDRCGADAS